MKKSQTKLPPIKKGVPVPTRNNRHNRVYGFHRMEVGDCIEVPLAKAESARASARSFKKRNPDFDFVTRSDPEKKIVRIWRIAQMRVVA